MAVISAPILVSPVGSMILAAIIFTLVEFVHRLSGPPDITDHQLLIVST